MSAEKLLEFIGSSRLVDDLTLQLIKDGWQRTNQPKDETEITNEMFRGGEKAQEKGGEKWSDVYDAFNTAIQESALTVVTEYHDLSDETHTLAEECVKIFNQLQQDNGLREAAQKVVFEYQRQYDLPTAIDELEKALK